jgi:NAD(P)-dependent dehydrogenase (short-subunit alcohol dehydrogenase family)
VSRAAIITGATGGLGPAVVSRLLDEGWRVVAAGRSETALAELGDHERLVPLQADLFDPASAAALADAAGDGLEAVVNLVGGYAEGGRVHETPLAAFEEQLRLNLVSAYLVTSAALPVLLKRPGPSRGSIICFSSRAAIQPFAGAAGYITAKAAVLGFVDALDAEYRADGIRVNAIVPSVIDTPANRAAMPTADHGAWVTPEQIAGVIAHLVSGEGAAVTGSRVKVYGRA